MKYLCIKDLDVKDWFDSDNERVPGFRAFTKGVIYNLSEHQYAPGELVGNDDRGKIHRITMEFLDYHFHEVIGEVE